MENEERPRCALEMPAVNRWSLPGWCTIAQVACRAKSATRAGRQNRREILATDLRQIFTDCRRAEADGDSCHRLHGFYGLPEPEAEILPQITRILRIAGTGSGDSCHRLHRFSLIAGGRKRRFLPQITRIFTDCRRAEGRRFCHRLHGFSRIAGAGGGDYCRTEGSLNLWKRSVEFAIIGPMSYNMMKLRL
jgi:hypothetical protein